MIVKEFYKTRNDGVNLYKRFDAVVDGNGNFVKDTEGNYIPTGFKIRKVGTEEMYSEAIDIDGAPYVYEETDIDIEKLEEPRLIP